MCEVEMSVSEMREAEEEPLRGGIPKSWKIACSRRIEMGRKAALPHLSSNCPRKG